MLAIPALDLRGGACVQLIGGSYDAEAIRIADPVAVAHQWCDAGFSNLHIVDLDAATGRGSNAKLIARIVGETPMHCQVGGGIRDTDTISRLLESGAECVVLGTRALEEPEWLEIAAAQFPGRIIVAADTADRQIVTHGWMRTTATTVTDAVRSLAQLPLAAILVTAVHREGRMEGTDLELMRSVVEASRLPVQASGGISTVADLHSLAALGIQSAVLGMALYTRALDARSTATEFAA